MTIVAAVAPPGVSALLASISTGLQSAQQLERWYRDNREFLDSASAVVQSAAGRVNNVVSFLSQDEPLALAVTAAREGWSHYETPQGPTSLSVTNARGKRLRISPRRDWWQTGPQSKRRRFRFSVRSTYPRTYRRRRSLRRRF